MTAYQNDVPVLNWEQRTRASRRLKISIKNPDGSDKDLTGAAAAFRLGREGAQDAIEKDSNGNGITFDDPAGLGFPHRVVVTIDALDWDSLSEDFEHETHVTGTDGDRALVLRGSCRVTSSLFEDPPTS